MTEEEFILKLEEEFEDLPKGSLKTDTHFRDIEDWSSMHALIIIAMIDTEYDVNISGQELSEIETIHELYSIVQNKIGG
jgi:acyl carrier protein